MFACVGLQVILCDPIWKATPCSSDVGFPMKNVSGFNSISLNPLLVKTRMKNYGNSYSLETAILFFNINYGYRV